MAAYVTNHLKKGGMKVNGQIDIKAFYTETIAKYDPVGISENPLHTGALNHALSADAFYAIKHNHTGTKVAILCINGVLVVDLSPDGKVSNPQYPSLPYAFSNTDLKGGIAWSEDDRFIFIGANAQINVGNGRILVLEDVNGSFTNVVLNTNTGDSISDVDYRDGVFYYSRMATNTNVFYAWPFDEVAKAFGSQIPMPAQSTAEADGVDVSPNGQVVAFSAGGSVYIFTITSPKTYAHSVTLGGIGFARKMGWLSDRVLGTSRDSSPYMNLIDYDKDNHTASRKPNQTVTTIPTGGTSWCVASYPYFIVARGGEQAYVYRSIEDTQQAQILKYLGSGGAVGALKSVTVNGKVDSMVTGGYAGLVIDAFQLGVRATKLDNQAEIRSTSYSATGIALQKGDRGDKCKVSQILSI